MAGDKTKRGGREREFVAGRQGYDMQGYEIEYLAQKTGIPVEQARDLIKHHCNNREKLERWARKLDAKGGVEI